MKTLPSSQLLDIVARASGARPDMVSLTSDLFIDLRMDSLDLLYALADIEKLGFEIDPAKAPAMRTVADLLAALEPMPA